MRTTELSPYTYTPYTTPLTRCTLPDGTTEYRHSKTGKPVEVDQEDLFDLISYTHEQIFTLVEMLPEDIYSQYAYIFKGLIQNISATITLCDLAGELFDGFNSSTIIFMGEIISDATQELYAITNAATARIDALEAQLRVCGAVAFSSPVKANLELIKGGAR